MSKLHIFFYSSSYPLNNPQPLFIPILNIHFEHFLPFITTTSYFTISISPSVIMFQLNHILALSLLLQYIVYYLLHTLWLIVLQKAPSTHPLIPFALAPQSVQFTLNSLQSFFLLQPHPLLNHPQSTHTIPYNPALLLPILAQWQKPWLQQKFSNFCPFPVNHHTHGKWSTNLHLKMHFSSCTLCYDSLKVFHFNTESLLSNLVNYVRFT